jgi:hypothetical protein
MLAFEETHCCLELVLLGLVGAVYQHTYFHVVLHQGGRRVVGDWLTPKLAFQETLVKLHDFLQPYL